jgi:uncharacterized caspase-like protein
MGKYALLIGVSEYPEGLGSLPAAKNDVAALAEVLADPNIGGFDQVQPLIDPPTVDAMRQGIDAFFRDRRPDDLVLLYFSGHGMTDPTGQFFFGTPQTRRDARGLVRSTAIPARDVHDYLKDCPT